MGAMCVLIATPWSSLTPNRTRVAPASSEQLPANCVIGASHGLSAWPPRWCKIKKPTNGYPWAQEKIMHIHKDDIVEVIAGDDAGTPKSRMTARVLRVLPDENKVVVEGVNRVYKHLK